MPPVPAGRPTASVPRAIEPPVFATGRGRKGAVMVRIAGIALGGFVLLWLIALIAGTLGFGGLPALPGVEQSQAPQAAKPHHPAIGRVKVHSQAQAATLFGVPAAGLATRAAGSGSAGSSGGSGSSSGGTSGTGTGTSPSGNGRGAPAGTTSGGRGSPDVTPSGKNVPGSGNGNGNANGLSR